MGSLRSQLQARNWQVIVESLGGSSLKSPSSAASSLCILGDRRAYILNHHRCAGSGRKRTGCEACESYSGVSPSLLETVGCLFLPHAARQISSFGTPRVF